MPEKKAPIAIRLFRCMECADLTNKIQEVEVEEFTTEWLGSGSIVKKAMLCQRCIQIGMRGRMH